VWSRVCAAPAAARALAGARLLVSGSAPLPAGVFADLRRLTGQAPIERYGMTETLITISTRPDGERRPGHVGLPVRGVRTRIVDDADRPVPADGETIGELQLAGPTLFTGYLHRPDATAAAHTPDGWFRTGDAATVDSTGMHRIVGRSSVDLIKTGGFRVGAGEVEDALLAHPAVREAAVVGAPHADLGQEIVAYVVADGAEPAELIAFVAEQLSVHKRPRRVVVLAELPRNAMGKVQKQLLH
jgi:fatty acid CoA ligase FadD36